MEALIESIKRHEGYRDRVYLDSEGKPTCGWGHHLWVGSKVPLEASEAFFKQDIAAAVSSFSTILPIFRKRLNPARARVVTEMIFNMNIQKVLKFRNFWMCVQNDDWNGAADNILWNDKANGIKTPYYTQVKGRAEELADIMRKGE